MPSELVLQVPGLPTPGSSRGAGGRGRRRQPHRARRPRPPPGSQGPRPRGSRRGPRAPRREGVGLPLQLLLLLNLQLRAPAALALRRHFGAHDLPALFSERGGRRVTAGLGVELPAGGPGPRRLRRRWWRPEPLQGRAAGLARASCPLRRGPRGGAAGGAGARRAAAVPGVERDVEGPRARGPA